MFTKEEIKKIRSEFWNQFKKWSAGLRSKNGKKGRWIMNDTGVKQVKLKFHFDDKIALTGIEIDTRNIEKRTELWEKFLSLKKMLDERTDFPVQWEKEYILDNQKTVSRIYSQLDSVSIYKKEDWKKVNQFFYKTMTHYENFFLEFCDYIKYQ